MATAIAWALGASMATSTLAQDASTDDDGEEEMVLETVVVTGVRASLMRAMDWKRDSVGVVDAITQEDIGKFPDQNLAEALQRIPGVSIDRSNNEGARITVRGFGPEFNLVTLNGRSMPTQGGRSFDFGDISTPGISAVEVIKTGRADLPTGGIGATVNMITSRPFDRRGMKAVVIGKAVHETSSSDGDLGGLSEYTPEIAAIYSNTFADDKFGFMVSAAYEERDNREEFARVDAWIPNYGLAGGTVENNNQRADGVWWHPQDAGYGLSDISRERINGQLVLQFAPSDTVEISLDYTYSEVDFEKDTNSFGIWFANPNIEAVVNERGTVTEVAQVAGDYAFNVARDHTKKENESLGLNIDWQVNDSLTLEFDAHDSSSNLKGAGLGDGVPGSSANLIVGNTFCDWCGFVDGAGPFTANISRKSAVYPANGIPIWDIEFFNTGTGEPQAELLPSDLGSLFGQAFDVDNTNDLTQMQLKGRWDSESGGAFTGLDFGVSFTDQEYVNRNAFSGLLPAGFWLTSAQYWPDDEWERRTFGGLLSDFSNSGNFPIDWYYLNDFGYVVDIYESLDASGDPVGTGVYWPGWPAAQQEADGSRGFFWPGPLGNASGGGVQEDLSAVYLQASFEHYFGDMPFTARVGVRYEDVEVTSTGDEVPVTEVIWVGGDEFVSVFASDTTFVTGRGSNTELLPNIDLDLEINDEMKARFSYSRTLARPPIGAMAPVRGFTGNPNPNGGRRVSTGNPDLLPYLSDNFDISFEWYYAEGSYASIGYFHKEVDNFLVSTTTQEAFEGILDPWRGAQAELAREQLEAEGIPTTNQNVFARINQNLGVDPTTPVRAEPGDPLVVWDVTTTTNAESGSIYGFEVQVQHMFGESGFGLQANATLADGDIDAGRDVFGVQFALPGLSDSYNLIGFYENDFLSARLAYNWRDEFLSGFDRFDAPVYTEDYGQWDLNVTWYANDNLSVFLEGLNITEEVQRVFVRYPEQFLRGNQYGARWNLGARWEF